MGQQELTHTLERVSRDHFNVMLAQDVSLTTQEKSGEVLVFRGDQRVARWLPVQQVLQYRPRDNRHKTAMTAGDVDDGLAWPLSCPECGGEMRIKYDRRNGDHTPFWSCKTFDRRPVMCYGRLPFELHPGEQTEWDAFLQDILHTGVGVEALKRRKRAELVARSLERVPESARPLVRRRKRRKGLAPLGFGVGRGDKRENLRCGATVVGTQSD